MIVMELGGWASSPPQDHLQRNGDPAGGHGGCQDEPLRRVLLLRVAPVRMESRLHNVSSSFYLLVNMRPAERVGFDLLHVLAVWPNP